MSNEPKHTATPIETIEEAAKRHEEINSNNFKMTASDDFKAGAKWQSEQTQSELESLRAVNAELIEALREAKDELKVFYKKTGIPPRIELDAKIYSTLAKYEKP